MCSVIMLNCLIWLWCGWCWVGCCIFLIIFVSLNWMRVCRFVMWLKRLLVKFLIWILCVI